MPFSPSSFLDCMILQGIRTFGETGSGQIEFRLTLVVMDGIEGIWGCGKGGYSLAVALLFSSSSSNSCSSMFWLGLDVLGSPPTSISLPKVIASWISKSSFKFSIVELESSLCS
ncbi:hypothetical protein ACFX2I_035325 [Malus domestica]